MKHKLIIEFDDEKIDPQVAEDSIKALGFDWFIDVGVLK